MLDSGCWMLDSGFSMFEFIRENPEHIQDISGLLIMVLYADCFPVFGLKQEYSLVDNILESCGLSYDLGFMDWYVFGEEKMADEVSNRTGETEGIIAGGFALATLIMSDQVTALHPLFGVPLFLYLIRDFKRPSSCCNRIIVSLTMSFVTLLFTCYPIDLILAHYGMAQSWDIILAIQCFFVSIFIFAVKAKFELRTKRGEA